MRVRHAKAEQRERIARDKRVGITEGERDERPERREWFAVNLLRELQASVALMTPDDP